MPEITVPRCVDWGVAARPYPGETESGDAYLVGDPPGLFFAAVVDGLGHSAQAAAAARAALGVLEGAERESLEALVQRSHEAARGTRGVAMSVVRCDLCRGVLAWLGVGNIEGVLFRAADRAGSKALGGAARRGGQRERLPSRGGVVGLRMPTLRPTSVRVACGDVLVLATDGIRNEFVDALDPQGTPQEMSWRVLAAHARRTDDALVLVARFGGEVL